MCSFKLCSQPSRESPSCSPPVLLSLQGLVCASCRGRRSCPTCNACQLVPSRVSQCRRPASSPGRAASTGERGLGGCRLPWLCSPLCSMSPWCVREKGAAKGPALFTYFTRVFLYLLQATPQTLCRSPCASFSSGCSVAGGRLGQRGSRITGGTKVAVILKTSL